MRTLDILRHIDRNRYHLGFCALSGLEGLLDEEIRNLGGEVNYCRLGMRFPMRFTRLLRDGQYDVVHSHVHYFSGYILRLAFRIGVPIRIAHYRSTKDDHGDNLRRQLQRRLMRRWVDKYATCILAVSEGAMRHAWSDHWKEDPRCSIIYNGLDTDPFYAPVDRESVCREFGLEGDCRLVIHVGRFDTSKNHLRLVDIFAVLLLKAPEARLLLVGRGENEIERSVRRRVIDQGINDRIIFAGERQDIARLLKSSDLMIFPSIREGLPGVVLEACAAGTPVIASDLPGIMEIADRVHGVIPLSIESDDKTWADLAYQVMSAPPVNGRREKAAAAFISSKFTISDCVMANCRAWQGDIP